MSNSNEKLKKLLEEVVKDNIHQGRAIKEIHTSNKHLFITGKAGSGKSFFMRRISKFIKNCAIVAPTGIAAINAGGSTMHSFFRLNLDPYYPSLGPNGLMRNYSASGDPNFRKLLRKTSTIIIDEISMVRADVLDKVSDVLQQARGINKPFGGVRLIMFGDLAQLPPVLKPEESDIFYENYESPYFFSSLALRMAGFEVIEFEKIYRQSDPVFIGILNNIRNGSLTEEDMEILNGRVMKAPDDFRGMRIVTHNAMADRINKAMVDKIDDKEYTFVATEVGLAPKDAKCERVLTIKVGEQVVITRNKSGFYYNGSMGIVKGFDKDTKEIVVELIDGDSKGREVNVEKAVWENCKYSVSDGSVCSQTIGTITQFPIKAGYACTAHSAQGMTFDGAIIDAASSFTNGQAYVSLSRCRTLENMYLSSRITNDQLIQDSKLLEFYDRVKAGSGVIEPEDVYRKKEEGTINFADFGL